MATALGERRSAGPGVPDRLLRPAPLVIGFALLILAFGTVSAEVLLDPSTGTAVWCPEAGVAVAALIRSGRRLRGPLTAALFLTLLAVAAAAGDDLWRDAPVHAAAGTVQALTATLVLQRLLRPGTPRRRIGDLVLQGPGDVARLTAATGVGVMVGAAILAAHSLLHDGTGSLASALLAARNHATAQLTGVLVLAPALLALRPQSGLVLGRRVEWVVQTLVTLAVTALAFAPGQELPLVFLPIVPLLWAAARLGLLRTACSLVLASTIVALGTLHGTGPFAGLGDPDLGTTVAQAMVIVQALSALALALTAERRDEALATLVSREESYRRTFDRALLGMALLRMTTTGAVIERANDAMTEILGPDIAGRRWTDLVAEDDRSAAASATLALRDGAMSGWRGELRHEASDGQRWLEVALAPLPEDDGSVTRLSAQVVDVTDRRLAEDQLRDMALHDPLTGLPNRTLLMDRVSLALAGAARSGQRIALLFCDLDDFKHVNDAAGHAHGDRMLVEVTGRLVGAVRPTDTVARLGGDEFAVLCPDVPDREAAEAIALRVLSALEEPVTIGGADYAPGGSIGIALSAPDSTVDSLLREADTAMYEAKRGGKRRMALFTHEQHENAVRTMRLESELLRAVEHAQFRLLFQPVVDLASGRVVAMEALVRWQHPERGLLAPGEWLEVAERGPVIHAMGSWVLQEACRTAMGWARNHGDAAPVMHVNVSPRQLATGRFPEEVAETLRRSGLPGSQLVLELTESELDRVRDSLRVDVHRLRATGVRLAADDFGTGYSSLTRVTELPVDMIKIDRRFVADMSTDGRSMAVVQAVLGLGQALGIQVVAEGVETVAQAEELRRLGCLSAQGFLWSPPQRAETARRMLDTPPPRIPAPRTAPPPTSEAVRRHDPAPAEHR